MKSNSHSPCKQTYSPYQSSTPYTLIASDNNAMVRWHIS